MNKQNKFTGISRTVLLTLMVIFFLTIFTGCSLTDLNPTTSSDAQIKLETDFFDMGNIKLADGIVSNTFKITNTGKSPLELQGISTSCGCTSAEVDSNLILPGDSAKLTVEYDPSVHPGLVGEFKRVVYVQSNDPKNPEIELVLVGTAIKSSGTKLNSADSNLLTKPHAENLKEFEISPSGAYSKLQNEKQVKFLDVRELFEYKEEHINGTQLLSVKELSQKKLDELGLAKDDEIIVYCRSGKRSEQAYKVMNSLGYTNVKSMNGGIIHWEEEGLPLVEGLDDLNSNSNSNNSSNSNSQLLKEQNGASNSDAPSVLNSKNEFKTALVYYNEACGMCSMYIKQELLPLLNKNIPNVILKDYVNEKENRVELNKLNKQYNIPPVLQGHFMIFLDNRVILGGHVPKQIIQDLFDKPIGVEPLLVLQDEMSEASSYFAWGFKGDAKEYPINTPIQEYLTWFDANKKTLKANDESYSKSWSFATMLPLIVATGFLDGINPCAFAVLLFFIAFLYTIHQTKASIIKMGVTYIFAIFLAYFLIGLGLMNAFIITGVPHLMAKIGAYLIIGLGLINLFNFLFPQSKFKLGIPAFSKKYLKHWMYKATIPSAFILGFLVGLCTFPCSGGMYVAVIGLLATKSTFAQGLVYLVIYNIFFVSPLIIMLIAAGNKKATEKITSWEQSQSKMIKLVSGLIMIALGLAILIWFV